MPRPSSPVHAKASTKCSYLTLENPHHQRQACIKPALFLGADDNLSQITHLLCRMLFARSLEEIGRHAPRHRLKTHSQCQRSGQIPQTADKRRNSFLHPGVSLRRNGGSRRRKAGGASRDRTDDLKLAKLALSQLSYGPQQNQAAMVGRGGVEPPTSRLSGVRSNHLSYRPPFRTLPAKRPRAA